ncbi:MAG: hypothetical protein OHM57_07595 [Spiroplasma phoeniceum]|nr:MAG: hypothetical protein OHM57_07595 [Spiroplasma phoeniceum]
MAFQKQNKFDYFCYMKNNTKVILEFLESNLLDLDKELNNE